MASNITLFDEDPMQDQEMEFLKELMKWCTAAQRPKPGIMIRGPFGTGKPFHVSTFGKN